MKAFGRLALEGMAKVSLVDLPECLATQCVAEDSISNFGGQGKQWRTFVSGYPLCQSVSVLTYGFPSLQSLAVYLQVLLLALGCDVQHSVFEAVEATCWPLDHLVVALFRVGSFLRLLVGNRLARRHVG